MLKHAIEVFAAADGAQSVGVGEVGEHSNLVAVFKLGTDSHILRSRIGYRVID